MAPAAALRARRDREAARLADLRTRIDTVRAEGLPSRFLLDGERELVLLAAEIAWLDDVLRDLADDSLEWGGPPPHDFLAARARRLAATDTRSTP